MNRIEEFLQKLTLQGIHVWPQDGKLRYAGPQQRITDEVLNQLKEHKAELLPYLRQSTYSPPSAGQSGLWFIHQQRPENSAYTVSLACRIHSAIDVVLLSDSIQLLVNRHAALRTRFIWQEDVLVQQIDGYQAAAIERIEACDWNETTLLQQVRAFHERPFDLSTGPLFRVTIFNHTGHSNLGQSYTLLLSVHHIVVDGWSIYQLVDELFTFYHALRRGVVVELPLIQATYADYVAWQQTLLETEGERLYKVWQAQLQGELPVLQLPTDYSRPPQQTLRGISQPLHLSSTLTEQVKRLARQNNCTLYMVLLAAYQVLLHRYSGQEEILIGLPMAGRSRPEFAEIIGYFTSPVVARANINASSTFAHLLAQVKGQVLAALDNQDYPFVRLVKQLNPQRDVSCSPIFQASFVLQKPHRVQELLLHANRSEQFGLTLEPIPLPLCAGQDEIGLELTETSEGLVGALKGNADLFAQTTLARMAEHFQVLLAGIVAEPPLGVNQPIVELPMLTEAERQQLLVEWNGAATDYPQDKCIHHLFEEQVARPPDTVAVVMAENQRLGTGNGRWVCQESPVASPRSLTYRELNVRANQLAHHLQSLGVGSDVLVGICVERSIEMVVGLLAILKAGGAYVPLDPSYPAERLAFMLQDANPPVLLTQAHLLGQLPATTSKVVCLDLDWEEIATHGHDNPVSQVQADHLAYVIYTSGSTGRPKGTSVTHRNVVRLVQNTNFAQLTAEETFLQLAPIAFDAATLEIWGPLLNGGRLVVMKPGQPSLAAIGEAILHNGVTTLWLTAGLFHLMVEEQIEALRPLRQLLAGGDVLSVTHVKRFLQRIPTCRLINGYGPTENTTFTCCFPITHTEGIVTSVPIGRPIANTQAYILDPRLQPVPIGVAGELYAGGDGVAHGYLNRPDLTEEKFIANPFGEGKLYKTGDLARWLPDGNIEFLGRLDQQVKIRGFRIELGEIEAVLTQHPAVQEAVVIVREDESPMGAGEKRLVAYVVTKTEAGDGRRETHDRTARHQLQALRSHLQAKLPDYMLPSAFVLLDALPLTPNGKVDRKALPAPVNLHSSQDKAFVAPRTATERTLADIWSAVLGVEQISIHDNFFEVGGHSLLTVHLLQRIQASFAIALPLQRLFTEPTIAGIAPLIDAARPASSAPTVITSPIARQAAPSCLLPLRTDGTRPPFFCVHPLAGVVFPYYELAYHLGAEQPVYGLQAVGLVGQEAPLPSLDAMAAHYVEALQTVQPTGPYYLGGWSLGGLVAYVMAQQIEAAGETVACLAIIDTPAPSDALTITLTDALRFGVKTLAPAMGAYFIDYLQLWRQRQPALPLPPPHRLLRVTLASFRASRQVRLQSYPGHVTLLRSNQDFGAITQRSDLGWGDFACGGVDVVPVPGEHMTLVRQPHVPIVAERLTACLAKARQRLML